MKPFYRYFLDTLHKALPASPHPALEWYRIDEGDVEKVEPGWSRGAELWRYYGTGWVLVLATSGAAAVRIVRRRERAVARCHAKGGTRRLLKVGEYLSQKPHLDIWRNVDPADKDVRAVLQSKLHAAQDLEELYSLVECIEQVSVVMVAHLDMEFPTWGEAPDADCYALEVKSWDETRVLLYEENSALPWSVDTRVDCPDDARPTGDLLKVVERALMADVDTTRGLGALAILKRRAKDFR